MNDTNYPWFVLVPDREDATEIHQLSEADQQVFIRESSLLADAIAQAFDADKLNIAALGNIVPQLHIHHIVRYTFDRAWPAPVWGRAPAVPYTTDQLNALLHRVMPMLEKHVAFSFDTVETLLSGSK